MFDPAREGMRANRHAILTIVVLIIVTLITVPTTFCVSKGISSRSDLDRYLAMRSSASPVMIALDSGRLRPGSSVEELLEIEPYVWQEEYGKYVIYHYTPKGSYDGMAVVTFNQKLTAASAGSCTWHWDFFDTTPAWISEKISLIKESRKLQQRMPDYKKYFQEHEGELLNELSETSVE